MWLITSELWWQRKKGFWYPCSLYPIRTENSIKKAVLSAWGMPRERWQLLRPNRPGDEKCMRRRERQRAAMRRKIVLQVLWGSGGRRLQIGQEGQEDAYSSFNVLVSKRVQLVFDLLWLPVYVSIRRTRSWLSHLHRVFRLQASQAPFYLIFTKCIHSFVHPPPQSCYLHAH